MADPGISTLWEIFLLSKALWCFATWTKNTHPRIISGPNPFPLSQYQVKVCKDIFSGWEQLLDGLAGMLVTLLSLYSEKNVCLMGMLFKAEDKMLQEELPCRETRSGHSRWTSSIPAGVAPVPQIGLQYHREKEMTVECWLPSRHFLYNRNNHCTVVIIQCDADWK